MKCWEMTSVLTAILVNCAALVSPWAQTPIPVQESRGVWLDKGQMMEGQEKLLARLDRLQEAGFNTIYVATQIRGYVMYPDSQVLPQWEEAKGKARLVLDWLIPAIHERGMRAEAWTEFGFYSYYTRDATKDPSCGPILDRHPQLAAVDRNGKNYLHNENLGDFYSLCPSNPKAQEILAQLYVEMLERYGFDGLNLDRIRYPDRSFCYCDYCREHFEKDTAIALEPVAAGSKEEEAFLQWRKEQLTEFMEKFSKRFRERFPNAKLTSAVVPLSMMDDKGQDWPTWLKEGYLDAAMPMLYAADITKMVDDIRRETPPAALVFYGLDAGQGLGTLTQQITELRARGTAGLTIWHAGPVEPLLPDIRRNLFGAPAVSPLYAPGEKKE